MELNPDVLNEVDELLLTTVPPPILLPTEYVVASTGFELNELLVLCTTTYPFALLAVNEPFIELLVTDEKLNDVGCDEGVAQGGYGVA